ncbi:hypothetical protein MAPG_04523 [Magnaporthiopsis poae ATCC 64411]|uniref:MYND-type domain-containing protein n=1 Tax=Magnaporthiopsis poae (strain ATCC 64411 / 73-15) TaxID=644358 RepID=A0A0C4DWY8_MAGP6|nr:hypothetical protein MAPG_04523 [Magnaporthiopsis poae ATCC 64411]
MLTPCITRPVAYLYALGNTPAINVARAVPPGINADILLLGCGDIRNLLYTAYAEKGMPPRKLDVTCCDVDDFVIARNAIFLSFLVDDIRPSLLPQLRSLYYDLFVDSTALEFLRPQLHRLAEAAGSWDGWLGGPYGSVIRFADRVTFNIFRRTLSKLSYAASTDGVASCLSLYQASLKASRCEMQTRVGPEGFVITALRSAAPLSLRVGDKPITSDLADSYRNYWHKAVQVIDPVHSTEFANPLFAQPIARGESVLHYGTDPVLGFHLGTAFAPLMPGSPIRMDVATRHGASKSTWAMQELFGEWTQALRETIGQGRLVVRFTSTDALALCHTLQYCAAKCPERPSAGVYRRQLRAKVLELDQDQYGGTAKGAVAPIMFDAIDTSNLADSLGALNILFSAGPLLKPAPWAALSTEMLTSPATDEREAFAKLLPGGTLAVAHMLGFTVSEYWTNLTATGAGLEIVGALLKGTDDGPARMFPSRMTWVPDAQLSGLRSTAPSRLKLDIDAVIGIIWRVYADMFEAENVKALLRSDPSTVKQVLLRNGGMPQSHRGTFVALFKALMSTVDTDWDAVSRAVLDKIYGDTTIIMGNNYVQELVALMHLHGIYTEQWLRSELKTDPYHCPASFQKWKHIPEVMAVTLVVPLEAVKKMFPVTDTGLPPALSFQVTLKSGLGAWVNYFGCVHMSLGTVKVQGSPQSEDCSIKVTEDRDGWHGSSPVLVSFYCPTSALQVEPTALISLDVQRTLQTFQMPNAGPGDPSMVFQTNLCDSSAVLFSKYLPGHSAHPSVSTYKEPNTSQLPACDSPFNKSFSLFIDTEREIAALTGRVDITDDEGKKLLAEKAPIQLRQTSPFIIEVVFGSDNLVYPLHFRLPIEKKGSRTKIARTSGYVEVIAPLANPTESEHLQGFMHPMVVAARASNEDDAVTIPSILSSTLSYVNLDTLPILQVAVPDKEPLRWLTTLTSHAFSNRERRIREQLQSSDISEALKLTPAATVRTNFKESLFSIYMVASGLQGGQTGFFALEKADGGAGNAGVQMLIVVSALRLDCANGTVIADAAVLPLTRSLMARDSDLRAFLALSQSFEICYLKVIDQVALANLRTMRDRSGASPAPGPSTTTTATAAAGVPNDDGGGGNSQNMSSGDSVFSALRQMRLASNKCMTCGALEETPLLTSPSPLPGPGVVELSRCNGCKWAKYCSRDCQRRDWKHHKSECVANASEAAD